MKTIKLICVLFGMGMTYTFGAVTYNLGTTGKSSISITIEQFKENSVKFTVNSSMIGDDYVKSIGFNLLNDYTSYPIQFKSFENKGALDDPFIGNGIQSYDIWLSFNTSSSANGNKRFNGNESFSYTINGITENDFTPSFTATIGSVNGDLVIPETTTVTFLAIGMVCLLTKRFK